MTPSTAGRVLGIDLGERRIGVAVSDGARILASPVEVVARSGDRAADHRRLRQLADEWEVVEVVVGHPIDLEGRRGPAARNVEAEVDEIRSALSVPVLLHDERLSTASADRALKEQGMDGRKRRKVVDKVAAAVILQSWLDTHR